MKQNFELHFPFSLVVTQTRQTTVDHQSVLEAPSKFTLDTCKHLRFISCTFMKPLHSCTGPHPKFHRCHLSKWIRCTVTVVTHLYSLSAAFTCLSTELFLLVDFTRDLVVPCSEPPHPRHHPGLVLRLQSAMLRCEPATIYHISSRTSSTVRPADLRRRLP